MLASSIDYNPQTSIVQGLLQPQDLVFEELEGFLGYTVIGDKKVPLMADGGTPYYLNPAEYRFEIERCESIDPSLEGDDYNDQFKDVFGFDIGTEKTALMEYYERKKGKKTVDGGKISENYIVWLGEQYTGLMAGLTNKEIKQIVWKTEDVQKKIAEYKELSEEEIYVLRYMLLQEEGFPKTVYTELSKAVARSEIIEYNGKKIKVAELLTELDFLGFNIEYDEVLSSDSESFLEKHDDLFINFYGDLINFLTVVLEYGSEGSSGYVFANHLYYGEDFPFTRVGSALMGLDYKDLSSGERDRHSKFLRTHLNRKFHSIDYNRRMSFRSSITRNDFGFSSLFSQYESIQAQFEEGAINVDNEALREFLNNIKKPEAHLLKILNEIDKFYIPIDIYMAQILDKNSKTLITWNNLKVDSIMYHTLEGILEALRTQLKDIQENKNVYGFLNDNFDSIVAFYQTLLSVTNGLQYSNIQFKIDDKTTREVLNFVRKHVLLPNIASFFQFFGLTGQGFDKIPKFTLINTYFSYLISSNLFDSDTRGDFVFKDNYDITIFNEKFKDFVFGKLRENGLISDLHPDFRGSLLGDQDNKALFDLIVDTLIVLNKYIAETEDQDLLNYLHEVNMHIFSLTSLSGFITGNNNKYYRSLFTRLFLSGLPMTEELCGTIIFKLNGIKIMGIISEDLGGEFESLIEKFEGYKELAPEVIDISSSTFSHTSFFLSSITYTRQMYEFTKITMLLDPFLCSFMFENQLTGDSSVTSKEEASVRHHLEGNSFFEYMYEFIDHSQGTSIWKSFVKFKFMLAPISTPAHYYDLHDRFLKAYNLIIQARMYHLYEITSSGREFSTQELMDEFQSRKIADYIKPEALKEIDAEWKQKYGDELSDYFDITKMSLWGTSPFSSDVEKYGFDFDHEFFADTIEEFKDRLSEFKTSSRSEWFKKILKQEAFYEEKYEILVDLVKQYSWVGEAPGLLNPSITNLLGITPRDAWNHFISSFCVIDEHQNIELLNIFDLLNMGPEPTKKSEES